MSYCIDEDFAHWAFGRETWNKFLIWEADSIDLMNAWNELHGHLYLLREIDEVEKSMKDMKEIYEQQKT